MNAPATKTFVAADVRRLHSILDFRFWISYLKVGAFSRRLLQFGWIDPRSLLAFRGEGWIAVAVLWLGCLLACYAALFAVVRGWLGAFMLQPSLADTAGWWARECAMFAPLAFVEELLFRGVLQQGLFRWFFARNDRQRRSVFGLSPENLATSGLFALAHLIFVSPTAALLAFAGGLVLGTVVERSRGSLWPAIVLHALTNLSIGWFALLVRMNTPWL